MKPALHHPVITRRVHLKSMRGLLALLTALSGRPLLLTAAEPPNSKCPIMTEDEADPDATVSYQGVDIAFCCGPCIRQFKKEPDYYVKLFQEMKSVPQVQNLKVPDEVKLLEQRFCPFSTERVIGPACPSADFKGVKIYLSKPGHLATWNEEPEKHAREAFAKGLLPQLQGKL